MTQKGQALIFLIVGILVVVIAGGAFYLGKTFQKSTSTSSSVIVSQTPRPTSSPTPQSTAVPQPTLVPDETTNPDSIGASWKTYTNDIFSFQYPNNWYVNKYEGSSNFVYFVQVSDIQNSFNVIQGASNTHTRIDIGNYASSIPSSFPYTNGSSANNTIKPFKINTLSGIRGQETSEAGLVDVVYLQNPKGGYVSLVLTPPTNNQTNVEQIFNQILSTFKFIP